MDKQNLTTGFRDVDHSQYQFLIKFLEDVAIMPQVLEAFELQLKWLDIQDGNQVLDVGCGIGVQAQAMAKLVGGKGKVTGTDLSNVMVEIAKERSAMSGLSLEFFVADAVSQPFPDHSFDRIRTERVLMYVQDTQQVLKEYKRLLKPGGKLVLFDFDWDATLIAHSDKALTRKIIRYASDSFPRGRVGGELLREIRKAGFKNVKIKPHSYSGNDRLVLDITKRIYEGILQTGISNNVFTETEIANWWNAFDKEGEEGDLFISFQGFIVGGTND